MIQVFITAKLYTRVWVVYKWADREMWAAWKGATAEMKCVLSSKVKYLRFGHGPEFRVGRVTVA